MPALRFHATATPLFRLGACPVLADVGSRGQFGLDDAARRITPRTKAVVAVHLWGLPEDVDALAAFCTRHSVMLLEDGSHAHGATWRGQPVGSFGRAAAFSLNGPKPLSAGEGGFVATDDTELYFRVLLHGQYNKRCRREIPAARALARTRSPEWVSSCGSTPWQPRWRMPNFPGWRAISSAEERLPPGCCGLCATCQASMCRSRRPLPVRPGTRCCCATTRTSSPACPSNGSSKPSTPRGAREVDLPGSTRSLGDHQLFHTPGALLPGYADHQGPAADSYANARRVHGSTVKLPLWHRDQDLHLAEAYTAAIIKVADHHKDLVK